MQMARLEETMGHLREGLAKERAKTGDLERRQEELACKVESLNSEWQERVEAVQRLLEATHKQ